MWESYEVCISQENRTQAGEFDEKNLKWGTSHKGIGRAETK